MKRLIVPVMVFALTGFLFIDTYAHAQAQETAKNEPWQPKMISLSVGAGARNFSAALFKEVYGSAPMSYNVDLGARVWKSLEIFVHTDYLKAKGKTTYTKEDTTLTLIPIELGIRYLADISRSSRMKIFPYLGVGAGYYSIKDEHPAETVKENRLGFFAEGGLRFYPMKSFFIDAKLKQVILKSENGTNLGGLAYMGGIGVSF